MSRISKPHIIIINPDQWRGDVLGCHGNPAAQTPNLDALVADDAVSFRNAFCQNPVCTPSRCSFMSGRYPHVRGHRTMYHMLQPDEPVLLRDLKDAGYFVWWGGKNDLVPAQRGFAEFCDVHFDVADSGRPVRPLWAIDRAQDWRGPRDGDNWFSFYAGRIETEDGADHYPDQDWACIQGAIDHITLWGERRAAGDDQPLCLYLPIVYPHPPYAVEDPWYSAIDRGALPPRAPAVEEGMPGMLAAIRDNLGLGSWDEQRWDELRATYYGMCARVDHQIGLVVEALRRAGLYDESAIFVFSDHGDFTGDYGLVEKAQNTLQDCLTRVPFIVKPPRDVAVKPGVRSALVELVDFPATVHDLAEITPAYSHFGRSLLPVISGDTPDEHRDAVFSEGGRLADERHAMELESAGDFSRDNLYWPRLVAQAQPGPLHTKAAMCRTHEFKYVRRLDEADELYDLRVDPQELRNVIHDEDYAAVQRTMSDRLLTWYQETCDVVPWQADRRE